MKIFQRILRRAIKHTGYLALAGAALLTVSLRAQNYSSSSNNQQPYNNNPYNNPPYNNQQRPRYTGHSWADHWVFEGGAGVTPAAGNTQNYANTGFNVLLGTGYKFSKRLSLLAEWNFNYLFVPNSLAAVIAATPQGNEHIWTADLNPKYDFMRRGRIDGYVIGGGGFSRSLTNFTSPVVVGCGYGFGYGYGGCVGSLTVAHTSNNQGNIDVGLGSEWRFSPYEREKLFLEARYERLFSPNNGLPPGGGATYIPVTIGVRW